MEYNLNFMHPQYGTIFNADIDGSFTMSEMAENLVLSGFLPENIAGYQLALGKKILDRNRIFSEVEGLEDGDVIRIITTQIQDIPTQTISKKIGIHIMHPNRSLALDIDLDKEEPLANVVTLLIAKNFINLLPEDIFLRKGTAILDLQKNAAENGIIKGDYIEIGLKNSKTEVSELNEKLTTLDEKLQKELAHIKNSMPSANLIPIDPTRAVNPTMETYESIDTIVNRLRKDSKQQALKPIRVVPMNLFWAGGAFLSLVALLVIYLTVLS